MVVVVDSFDAGNVVATVMNVSSLIGVAQLVQKSAVRF